MHEKLKSENLKFVAMKNLLYGIVDFYKSPVGSTGTLQVKSDM